MQAAEVVTDETPGKFVAVDPKYRPSAIETILERALVSNDVSLERLEKLYQLKREYDADQARNAFTEDMAAFKAEPVIIEKDREVDFTSQKGRTHYWHASIGNIVQKLVPALAKHGFSHRWDQKTDGGLITITCILTHRQGHSERYTLTAKPDESGNKNSIQAINSTCTYLQRYTLLGVTGYATSDQPDDDGGSAELSEAVANAQAKKEALINEWKKALLETKTPADLQRVKRDLVTACAGADMVPEQLMAVYTQRVSEMQDEALRGKK